MILGLHIHTAVIAFWKQTMLLHVWANFLFGVVLPLKSNPSRARVPLETTNHQTVHEYDIDIYDILYMFTKMRTSYSNIWQFCFTYTERQVFIIYKCRSCDTNCPACACDEITCVVPGPLSPLPVFYEPFICFTLGLTQHRQSSTANCQWTLNDVHFWYADVGSL